MTSSAPARRPVLRGVTPSPHAAVRSALALLEGDDGALRDVAAELAAGLSGGADDVRVERPDRLLYATDASIYEMEPVAVVFPRSAADVQHVLRVAGRCGVAVLPRGGGTSLAGQGVNHAIVLDFTPHMNRVLSIDPAARTARVQPGVVLTQLSAAAREHGLRFPVDPSTANRATIGGGIGNNSCGAHSGLYGKMADNVVALDVVLADGSLVTLAPLDAAALAGKRAQSDLEGAIYRAAGALATAHAEEIGRRFPDIPRRVSGYNLDAVLRAPGNL
ncbi:MAG: FAD-binding oxidoreductase, partial [Chloroflexota bacterium]|nr:FAD-binding oxidoreductase [Chloroflexota bacterium]